MDAQQLMDQARQTLPRSYSPYSHFPVACAILMGDGQVVCGVNVENVSFGATNCAERTALFTAITQGYQKEDIKAMAITGDTSYFLPPCNICRQVMVELMPMETPIYLTRQDGQLYETRLKDLTPLAFIEM